MFQVGQQVLAGGFIAEVIKVIQIGEQIIYQLLVQNPQVKTVTHQQLTAQPGQVVPPSSPVPPASRIPA